MKNRMRILLLLSITLIGLIVSTSCAASKTPTITTNSLPEGTEGVAYSQTLQVHGGTPPYTWFAMATLPPGLQLDPLSGLISGTPWLVGTGFRLFPGKRRYRYGVEKKLLITVNPTTALTSTTTTTSNMVGSASSSSANGLKLSLLVDATPNVQHQISITLDERIHCPRLIMCPYLTIGYTKFRCCSLQLYLSLRNCSVSGDYSSSNLSTGTPLTLYDPM